jgi:hypothetical protein
MYFVMQSASLWLLRSSRSWLQGFIFFIATFWVGLLVVTTAQPPSRQSRINAYCVKPHNCWVAIIGIRISLRLTMAFKKAYSGDHYSEPSNSATGKVMHRHHVVDDDRHGDSLSSSIGMTDRRRPLARCMIPRLAQFIYISFYIFMVIDMTCMFNYMLISYSKLDHDYDRSIYLLNLY